MQNIKRHQKKYKKAKVLSQFKRMNSNNKKKTSSIIMKFIPNENKPQNCIDNRLFGNKQNIFLMFLFSLILNIKKKMQKKTI